MNVTSEELTRQDFIKATNSIQDIFYSLERVALEYRIKLKRIEIDLFRLEETFNDEDESPVVSRKELNELEDISLMLEDAVDSLKYKLEL